MLPCADSKSIRQRTVVETGRTGVVMILRLNELLIRKPAAVLPAPQGKITAVVAATSPRFAAHGSR